MKILYKAICLILLLSSLNGSVFGSSTTIESKKCVDSGYKNIKGNYGTYQVYRDCWRWEYTYKVVDGPYFNEDSSCSIHRNNGCGQINNACNNWNSEYGFCELSTLTFQCSRITSERKTELCGNLLSCPDGNCVAEYNHQKDTSNDFKQAAAALAVAEEIAKEFDYDNLSVFKGEGKKCSKAIAGIANCCKDSGWGTDIGLLDCDTEEEELGIKREQKAAHFVGKYCSEDILGVCISNKHSYCTYPSKLTRIIVEQGNAQLNRGYGSAKEPICEGFAIAELESLDFNRMDFSEFYDDVTQDAENGTIGDPNQLIQDISDRFNQVGED